MNKELLFEDVTFPIKTEMRYCFDSRSEMVCNIYEEELCYKIDGDYKNEGEQDIQFKLENGNFICIDTGEKVGMVRGWGTLQYKDRAEERQDNIAEYLLRCLNRKS